MIGSAAASSRPAPHLHATVRGVRDEELVLVAERDVVRIAELAVQVSLLAEAHELLALAPSQMVTK